MTLQHSTRYKRSPFLLISWDKNEKLTVTHCDVFRQFHISELVFTLLQRLSNLMTLDELSNSFEQFPKELIKKIVLQLYSVGLVIDEHESEKEKLLYWNLFELCVQRQTSYGGLRETPLSTPAPAPFKKVNSTQVISLPEIDYGLGQDLYDVLNARKSIRLYSSSPLTFEELAQFLYFSAHVKGVFNSQESQWSRRTYPGGGGCHSLELYLLCNDVTELQKGVYYYHPLEHALYFLMKPDSRYKEILQTIRANTGQKLNRDPCVAVIITSVFGRTMWKYERLSLATIYRDVGCLLQTMYLVATNMKLAPCAIGGIQDRINSLWLQLSPLEEAQVGCFILGKTTKT
jgi:SagB-type dehydrogenase family enzyme